MFRERIMMMGFQRVEVLKYVDKKIKSGVGRHGMSV